MEVLGTIDDPYTLTLNLSFSYLDHINGRKHQRKLGYSMRVERSTKDDTKSIVTTFIKPSLCKYCFVDPDKIYRI